MPHPTIVCEPNPVPISLTTGAATSRATAGANPTIPSHSILRQVCVELPTSSAPIHAVIHLVHEGIVIELKAGWVRGPSDHGGAGALIWDGDLSVGRGASLFVFMRNDTGGTLVPTLHFVVEVR